MLYFNNDYSEGCHPAVLEALVRTNSEQTGGYGTDPYCEKAAELIRKACEKEDLYVQFLVGGTQTNLTVIAAGLRPHQGVVSAQTGHIHVHETGAVEATGHKILAVSSEDGKITASQIASLAQGHRNDPSFEHTVQPGMVYLSHPTELGTLYSRKELCEISAVCREAGMLLFLDGARLGYGLTAPGNDITLRDLAELCDVFYIGGTKVGALFGEAVVIPNPMLAMDFRYLIKQRGGMLAKGRLLGIQFAALFTDSLYYRLGTHANAMAQKIRQTLEALSCPFLIQGVTNQIFVILPDDVLEKLSKSFTFSFQERMDATHCAVRICTSWATTAEQVEVLCEALRRYI